MILAVVKGNVVSTNKTEKLHGGKLLIVEEWNIDTKACSGRPLVALDIVGAGVGELVMCVSGSSSRQTPETEKKPVDLAIIGIVDQAEMDGRTCYKKYPDSPEKEPQKEPEKAPEKEPEAPAAAQQPPEPAAVPEDPVKPQPAQAPAKAVKPAAKHSRSKGK